MRKVVAMVLLSFAFFSYAASEREGKPSASKPDKSEEKAQLDPKMNARIPVAIAVSPDMAKESRDEKNHEAKESVNWEMLTGLSTFALSVITAFLAYFTLKLWRSTRKLVEGAEEIAKRELRAYVALNTVEHDETIIDGNRVFPTDKIKIRIQNYGRTPAHHVSVIQTCFETFREDTYRHPVVIEGDKLANQMLHPGQAFNHNVFYREGDVCIDRVIDVGIHQQSVFYIYGRIDYMDIYKRYWITYFCQRYDPRMPEGKRCSPHHHHNYEYPIA